MSLTKSRCSDPGRPMTERDAVLSPDGRYRYTLVRRWGPGLPLVVTMLNPSTADATQDDPTIRRCLGFAKRLGFRALKVTNLYAYRATDPADLWRTHWDIEGPHNRLHLRQTLFESEAIICAWGAGNRYPGTVGWFLDCADAMGRRLLCWGTTADGSPRHPLYLPRDAELGPFPARPVPEDLAV